MALKSASSNRLFVRAPAAALKTVGLVLASVLLMTMDRQLGHLGRVREGISLLVYPVRAAADLPFTAWDWLAESLASRVSLLKQNEDLQKKLLVQNAQLQRLATLEQENERLRDLLASAREVEGDVYVAELLRADLDPFRHRVTINRGSSDGVVVGEALLDASGVIGQVTHVSPLSSEVILITDPGHAIPVEVNRNGVRTVALGTGALNRLDLPFLANSADVQEGDLLVTSGLGGRFPHGYPVAVIDEIKRDPGQAFASVTARPVAQLDRLRQVLLVRTREIPLASEAAPVTDAETGNE